ncbi:MAG: Arylsulfatase [Bacteroidetes bacterium ADurb.BinA174]|nr:MAG: Arylsulfatase [Bacteroidetes bacterium ADurb.BinA174]
MRIIIKMNFNKTKLIVPLAGATALASCVGKAQQESKPLNIVYIMTDDHTRQMMSCYDNRHIETPNLDRIANNGVIFRNAFVANSISGPSRACLITGKHSHKNGKLDNSTAFDGSQQTVQQLLRQAGYQTAMVGKWHLDSEPTNFDHWIILPGQGNYYQPDFITSEGRKNFKGYATDLITDFGLDWLENGRDKEKPFCLFLHHKAAHRNWMSDTTHLKDFEDKTFELPTNFYDDYTGRKAASTQEMSIASAHDMDVVNDLKMYRPGVKTRLSEGYIHGEYARLDSAQKAAWDAHYQPIIDEFYAANLQGKELAEWKYQRYMRDYAKTIRSLDENIGRVLDYLEKNNMMENTIIIYTSDQGFYMGEHGWFDKRFMYEESFSTPLIMQLPPRFKKHGEIAQLVQNIDFAPTMLEIAGVEIPSDIQGVSLLPLLENEKAPKNWRKSLYYHYYEFPGEHAVKRHFGVRTDRYKLIHFYNDIDEWELFDLQQDPNEMNNLYGKAGYEEITKELKAELKRLQEQYDDPIREKFPL